MVLYGVYLSLSLSHLVALLQEVEAFVKGDSVHFLHLFKPSHCLHPCKGQAQRHGTEAPA